MTQTQTPTPTTQRVRTAITNLELGRLADVPADLVVRLAAALGVHTLDLMGPEDWRHEYALYRDGWDAAMRHIRDLAEQHLGGAR